MSTMADVKNDVHFTLIKGEPGTRKSTQALSYPKPMYWFSFDQKMNALSIPMRKWNIDPKQISYDDYNDWNKARAQLEKFQVNCPFKTIVLDSITSNADAMIRQAILLKKGVTRASGSAAGKSIGGISVAEIEDYNAESAGLTEMIALLKDIHKFHKIDIILIAHIIRTESKSLDGVTNVSRVIVTAGKKPAAKIPAYCDEIYHFGVETALEVGKGGTYTCLTSNVGDDYARTTLELPMLIKIQEGDNLYEKYIKPAIDKQKLLPQKQETTF
jgi:hypothetical protein